MRPTQWPSPWKHNCVVAPGKKKTPFIFPIVAWVGGWMQRMYETLSISGPTDEQPCIKNLSQNVAASVPNDSQGAIWHVGYCSMQISNEKSDFRTHSSPLHLFLLRKKLQNFVPKDLPEDVSRWCLEKGLCGRNSLWMEIDFGEDLIRCPSKKGRQSKRCVCVCVAFDPYSADPYIWSQEWSIRQDFLILT